MFCSPVLASFVARSASEMPDSGRPGARGRPLWCTVRAQWDGALVLCWGPEPSCPRSTLTTTFVGQSASSRCPQGGTWRAASLEIGAELSHPGASHGDEHGGRARAAQAGLSQHHQPLQRWHPGRGKTPSQDRDPRAVRGGWSVGQRTHIQDRRLRKAPTDGEGAQSYQIGAPTD